MAPEKLPRNPQEHPRGAQEPPKRLSRAPKGAQESPKTLSEPWSDQTRRFFRIRRMPKLKSMILRVGGSSWELKIEPERVEEENKHVLEEDKSQRRCQESRKMLPRSPRVTMYWHCRVTMSSQNGPKRLQGEPKRPPRAFMRNSRGPPETPKGTKRGPREPSETLKTIFGSKALIL